MQSSLVPPQSISFWQRVRRAAPHELKVFAIHYGLWLFLSILSVFSLFLLPAKDYDKMPSMARYFADKWSFITDSIFLNFLVLLPVHGCYFVYRLIVRKTRVWNIVAFGAFLVFYLFFLSVCAGFYVAYTHNRVTQEEALIVVFFTWAYSLLFIGIRIYRHNRRQQVELQRQKAEAEIAALKSQVNPHFLFNTLNNLYGTALTGDTNRTAAGIEQLSGVMRHMVEESKRDRTPIQKEIQFLEDTVELHRMRLPKSDAISVQSIMEWDEQPGPNGPVEIAPLLLVSFVENAFKYGISVSQNCFVHIQLNVEQGRLHFVCQNSIVAANRLQSSTGTGIDNIRQRLQLIYPNRHILSLTEKDNVFRVELTIHL
ncbi:sensor histidine kinase [Tellurirhabdus bombi]|uniref:sensor histidine kinase n=1 Tax=Tellurirhabdus bombi TaxID=2907205 RepID=UPI001F29FBE3|nr:sensor histidine kinase [Tellurirhabdus bombi]